MAKYIKLEELMRFPIRRNHYDKEHGSKDFIYGYDGWIMEMWPEWEDAVVTH